MASIERRRTASGEIRWDVRYRDPDRRHRMRTFHRKADAQKFANVVEADIARGDWLDPGLGRETFGDWAGRWLPTIAALTPKTRESYESILRRHLLSRLEDTPVYRIDHPTVVALMADLTSNGAGAGTVRNVRDVLRLVLELARRSGAIKVNPVEGAKAPKKPPARMVFLDADQIMTLAEEVANPPTRRRQRGSPRSHPSRAWASRAFRRVHRSPLGRDRGPPNRRSRPPPRPGTRRRVGHRGVRQASVRTTEDIPTPGRASPPDSGCRADWTSCRQDELRLRLHIIERWTPRHSNFYARHFKPAVVRAGLPEATRFHDLRHSYAAMLIAEGAHPRAIMERLGHSTIQVTLGTYGHLFPSLEASLTEAMDGVYRRAEAVPPAEVRRLES